MHSNLGRRLLVFSANDPTAAHLLRAAAPWGCVVSVCATVPELRRRIEEAEHDFVLVEPAAILQLLVTAGNPDASAQLTLAEVERRHILRVMDAMGGNKTRAARSLGIDTKTVYTKLKCFETSEAISRRRLRGLGAPFRP